MADAFAHETLLDTATAAKRLGVSPSFLAKARMQGVGPPYCKFGRVVRYTPANLDRYQIEHSRTSTAEQRAVIAPGRATSAKPERQKRLSIAVDDESAPLRPPHSAQRRLARPP
jgi:hypothetical protein